MTTRALVPMRQLVARTVVLASAALAVGLSGCAPPPAPKASARRSIAEAMTASQRAEFLPITEPRAFEFPRDFGPHRDQHIEWWYFTGHLKAQDEDRWFGFQLTFFRTGLAREAPATDSPWRTRDLWMSHFAVGDFQAGRFHVRERFAREALGLAGGHAGPGEPFAVWTLGLSARSLGEDLFPMRLSAEEPGLGLELRLDRLKPLVLQGKDGYSRKGDEPGNASHYLQHPRLSAEGRLRIDDRTYTVRGRAWKDQEWSTSVLGEELVGWDWFAIQLEDGRDIMLYDLRRKDGQIAAHRSATLIDAEGALTKFGAAEFSIEVLDRWTSPHSGITYPARWRLRLPQAGLDLWVTPAMPDQELRVAVTYYEGAALVTEAPGDRGAPIGRAFVELVGYD